MNMQSATVLEGGVIGGPVFYRIWRRVAAWFLPSDNTLFSPAADILFAGGASLATFVAIYFFIDKNANVSSWSWMAYYLSFLVNYPHFAASYQLMYGDARKGFTDVRNNKKFALKLWWAGVIVPLAIIGYFVYALAQENLELMGYMANALFFFVGWHYVKQIFGCVIVLSSARRIYYNKIERWAILLPLYALWALSFISANLYGSTHKFFEIGYKAWHWSGLFQYAAYALLAVGTLAMLAVFVLKYRRDRVLPPLSAIVAVAAIYVWYIPALSHPIYLYVIPFFHSLQYLLFVFAYRRNESVLGVGTGGEPATTLSLRRLTGAVPTLLFALSIVIVAIVLWKNFDLSLETLLSQEFGLLTLVPNTLWLLTAVIVSIIVAITLLLSFFARRNAYAAFSAFFTNSVVIGMLMFSIIPVSLDLLSRNNLLPSIFSYNTTLFGWTLYLFFITVFINIHHYFIDNVIWKNDDPYVRQYLFYRNK